jgi:predicted ribonuclease toxin of YeeF-YezG toxin-antitoxin module
MTSAGKSPVDRTADATKSAVDQSADATKSAVDRTASAMGEAATETEQRVRELNERIIEASRQGGELYLDVYERTLKSIADLEERVAGASQIEWITTVANAQANFTRELAEAYARAGRELLK